MPLATVSNFLSEFANALTNPIAYVTEHHKEMLKNMMVDEDETDEAETTHKVCDSKVVLLFLAV